MNRQQEQADYIARKFTEYLNEFHNYEQPFDDELDAWLYEKYANRLYRKQYFNFKQPYFSPSSANSCERELYMKLIKQRRDVDKVQPHQRRWTSIGTAIGDAMQREILLAERHYKRLTGKDPLFIFERTQHNEPFFEDFVKRMYPVVYNGKTFNLFGTCDGVMLFTLPNGNQIRVGLEIKSKQGSYSSTGYFSMKEAKEDHVKQCACYAEMYNLDYYIILYVNGSKKGWEMDEEDVEKYPDIRAFGIHVTQEIKDKVFTKFTNILEAVEKQEPPKLDVYKFLFNKYKKACVNSLTPNELAEIKQSYKNMYKSNLPKRFKEQVINNYIRFFNYLEGA